MSFLGMTMYVLRDFLVFKIFFMWLLLLLLLSDQEKGNAIKESNDLRFNILGYATLSLRGEGVRQSDGGQHVNLLRKCFIYKILFKGYVDLLSVLLIC